MSKSIKEYMVIWTDDGRVGLQRWPSNGQHLFDAYENSWGACEDHIHSFTFEQCKKALFIHAMHMIVRDGCDPKTVHNAMLELDEYRDGCAYDMPGLENAQ